MLSILKNKKFFISFTIILLSILILISGFYFVKNKLTLKNEMLSIQENYLKNYSRKKFVKNALKNIDLYNKSLMQNYILNNFDLFLKNNNNLLSSVIDYANLYKDSFDQLSKLKNINGIKSKDYREIHKYLNKFEYQKAIEKLQYLTLENNSNDILAQKNFFEGMIYELQFNLLSAKNSYLKATQLNSFEAKYYNNLGKVYYRLYDFDKSIAAFNNGLSVPNFTTKKNKNQELELLKNLANVYNTTKSFEKSFKTYSNILVNTLNIDDTNYEWLSIYNLAIIESIYGNYNTSIDYLKYSLKLAIKMKNNEYIAKSLNALSKIEYKYGNYESGKRNGLKAIKYAKKISNLGLMADSSYNVCLNYEFLGRVDLALIYCNKAIEINDILGKILNRPEYYQNNGKIYSFVSFLRNYKKSLEYYTTAYKISKQYGLLLSEVSSLDGMSENETMLNNFQNSIEYLKKLEILEDDIKINTCKDCNYANIMWRDGRTKEAIKLFKKAISYAMMTNNNLSLSSLSSNLAIIYYDNEEYNKALEYSTLALEADKKIYRFDHHYIKFQEGWQKKILNQINNKKR